ncbi:MAG: hypothetical protein O3C40_25570 [Planctomycetota bacterium]|nr:hypothetical protein [Planctomycetota bacterium]
MTALALSKTFSSKPLIAMFLLGLGLFSSSGANGQEAFQTKELRLEFMKRTLGELKLSFRAEPDKTLPLTASPVLRFSNPVRSSSSDGGVFLWLAGQRPIAAAAIWIRDKQQYGHDFTSLTAEPLQCVRDGKVVWSPARGVLISQPIEDATEASQNSPLRLAQMRKIAGRFSAEIGAWPAEGWTELRLMPQPIYRYASADEGVIDGAIFSLAVANDPEVLVQLELTRDTAEGMAKWSYSIARMSAIWMKVRLDDKILWEAEGYWHQPRSLNDPYMENFGVQ